MSHGSGTEALVELDFHSAWCHELERLEISVELAETLLSANEVIDLPEWTPPVMRGPLPSDLEPRARLVLERQLAVAHRLTQRLTTTGQQRNLAKRIRDNSTVDLPVYVDISA